MAELKTRPTAVGVDAFLAAVEPEARRADARALCALMARITGEPPTMWGASIVGFGRYRYTYDSGHSGEWARTGFSPRKSALTVYVMDGFPAHAPLMARLGRYKTGKSCLYLQRLADVDLEVLEALIRESLAHMAVRYPA